MSAAQVAKHTRLRWALTLTSVQGRSLPGTIGIHDTNSKHFSAAHLYVALSRATDGANVTILELGWSSEIGSIEPITQLLITKPVAQHFR